MSKEPKPVPIPKEEMGSLAAAIAAMPDSIPKDSRNDYGKYDYASADAVYRAVTPHLSRRGLAIWQQEKKGTFEVLRVVEPYKNKKGETVDMVTRSYIKVTYEFAITPNGVKPEEGQAEEFTILHQITGTQAYGAVRTYALKYWLRGKLGLATGDKEDDEGVIEKSEEPAPAVDTKKEEKKAEKQYDGEWSLNLETLKYESTGTFESPLASQRILWPLLKADFGPDADPEQVEKILEANKDIFDKFPEEAQKPFQELVDSVMARKEKPAEEKKEEKKEKAPADDEGPGRWQMNPETLEYESKGKWRSDAAKKRELVKVLEREFAPDAVAEEADQIFLANEQNILSLSSTQQERLYAMVDAIGKPAEENK